MAKYIVQHRRGTTTQWADKNTIIPMEGEIVIEIDEVNSLHKLKIGDGIHTYAELAYLQAGDEVISQVIAEAKPRVVTVTLTSNWTEVANDRYSQVIALDGITNRSRLDLQPSADMLAEFKQLGLVFVTENNGGIITVYSVGNMPLETYTMQATIVETECDGQEAVVGIPVGTPVAQADWNQTDETQADFIKNKPTDLVTETYVTEAVAQKTQVQIITQENTEILSTLQIQKLTQAEYDEKFASGSLDENILYLTPDEVTDTTHTHEISDITNLQQSLDAKVSTTRTINGKALNENIILSATDVGADISGSANTALGEAKAYTDSVRTTILSSSQVYTDNAVAQKTQVQILTWEADD